MQREEVVAVLQAWLSDARDEAAVWAWARAAKEETKKDDPLVRDVIDVLETLPFDLIDKEDALVMLDALDNPAEDADLGQNLLWNHLDGIDREARRERYRDHPFYGAFTGDIQ